MKRSIVALYRHRMSLLFTTVLVVLASRAYSLVGDLPRGAKDAILVLSLVAGLLCLILSFGGPRLLPARKTIVVVPPVRGRWLGMNSPASKVPSHGVRMYGQAYAIDLVHEPTDSGRPSFGGRRAMRAAEEYPAFGMPVFAMIDGVVVRAQDRQRDHRARSNGISIAYMMVEGAVRELGGPGFVVGNHITIRGEDGVHATVAHLRQGSATVSVGDVVRAGQRIASCGNSGNSSEPHVHAQLADQASLWTAQGIPMAFADVTLDDGDDLVVSLPGNQQHMTAPLRDADPVDR